MYSRSEWEEVQLDIAIMQYFTQCPKGKKEKRRVKKMKGKEKVKQKQHRVSVEPKKQKEKASVIITESTAMSRDSDYCAICQEKIVDSAPTMSVCPSNHIFHSACLAPQLRAEKKRFRCAVCRHHPDSRLRRFISECVTI
jgi:Ring finger domain